MNQPKRKSQQEVGRRPMVENSGVHDGGNGHPQEGTLAPKAPDRINKEDLALLSAMETEIKGMRQRQAILQRDLTILSADIYHKQDEFAEKARKIAEKYGLKDDEAFSVKTGEIRKALVRK